MTTITHPDPVRLSLIRRIFQALESLGTSLSPEALNWAVKLGDAFIENHNLTDKQINVLLNILKKHRDSIPGHVYYCERIK